MSISGRRSSLLNIDNWLDKCSNDEPDSMIYDPEYCNETATIRARQREPDLEALYRVVTDLCTKIGLPPDMVEERLNDIDECITTYYVTIQKDVNEEYEKLCQYKQDLLDQVQKMLNDLYLPSYESPENVTLLQHCKRLKSKFNELNTVKEKRMTRLQELRDKQTKHCLVLGIKAPPVKMKTDIPTEEELVKLANACSDLDKEEKRRKEKYNVLKDMIKKCMNELEYESDNDFERSVQSEKPSYTESHLLQMSDFHSKLEALYAKNQEKYEKLMTRLISLYDRLDVTQEEREYFLEVHNVCKPSLMVELEEEIERYEELKKQNIGKFIQKIKEELAIEYDRCFISAEEQDNFFSLSTVSGECDEELLELYEREVERMRRYYETNKDILEKFKKWRQMWKELIDLEIKADDPKRFNNRGGQLLLEEKKRKTLQKGLPKIEKELSALDVEHASANQGERFKVFNTNIDEFIAGCWDELNTAKEEEKRERQRAKMTEPTANRGRKAPNAQVVLKRTPTKRAAGPGITPTPNKLKCQRSILGTPANGTLRSNLTGMSGSVKKSAQKNIFNSQGNKASKGMQQSETKSLIPVSHNGQVSQRDKTTNSNGSNFSALSLSEQEFEDMIVTCPTSAKRNR